MRPDSNEDITITLPAHRDCDEAGAICTTGENQQQLSNSPSATVTGPAGDTPSGDPLTAAFSNAPGGHDGSTEFTFDLAFSENFPLGYATMRDHAFTIDGGTIEQAQRKVQGSNQNWTITVEPARQRSRQHHAAGDHRLRRRRGHLHRRRAEALELDHHHGPRPTVGQPKKGRAPRGHRNTGGRRQLAPNGRELRKRYTSEIRRHHRQ